MKAIKSLIGLMLVFALSCALLSCSSSEVDEEEVKTAAKELIEGSFIINEIFYGNGIPTVGEEEPEGYKEADPVFLSKYGLSDIESLKNMTKKVYSTAMSDAIFRTKLSAVSDNGVIISYAHYYQSSEEDGGDVGGKLMVLSGAEALFGEKNEYIYDTLTVESVKNGRVTLSVDVNVINSEEKSQKVTNNITLVYENDAWRLDTLTFIKYNNHK